MYREAHSLHSAENGHSLEFLLGLLPSAPSKEALSHRETAKSSQSNRWKGAPDTPIAESLTGDDDHKVSTEVQDS